MIGETELSISPDVLKFFFYCLVACNMRNIEGDDNDGLGKGNQSIFFFCYLSTQFERVNYNVDLGGI